MAKNLKGLVLLLGVVLLTAGCQKKDSSSSTTSSKDSQSSPVKKGQVKKSKSNFEIKKISAEEYRKKTETTDFSKFNDEVVFFETPGNKDSDKELKNITSICRKAGTKLYVVNIDTEEGKKITNEHIIAPYDAVMLVKDSGIMFLDLQGKYNEKTPNYILEKVFKSPPR
ncbi:hypothetical protein [Xylocopilactobacillus apis]|uniref:Lipoprotein n=1 Tax=Xylocopilactobacillus apis TaxID=2932183 RepID=A0AAU9DL84_9LACO|nr:hypothetical protein [Xylocopilactobacillus apis]BDR55553.1 hypothetical protein KIMC2_01150 [Xylocopilactobacillus apis]